MIRFVSAVLVEVLEALALRVLRSTERPCHLKSSKDASTFFLTALGQWLTDTVRSTDSQKLFSGTSIQCEVLSYHVLLLLKLKDVLFYSAALHIILVAPVFQVTLTLFL